MQYRLSILIAPWWDNFDLGERSCTLNERYAANDISLDEYQIHVINTIGLYEHYY